MKRYQCTLAYDGTNFSGYQVQPNQRTVQLELELALVKITKNPVKVIASGRTDAGVHAKGQVIHFDTALTMSDFQWKKALNRLLPKDIVIGSVKQVEDDFHARYQAVKKEYRYFVWCGQNADPFQRNYTTFVPEKLNISLMQEAIHYVIGTHDFSSFCASNTSVVDKVRTIEIAEIISENEKLIFRFVGNGFLYNMVRIIVGTLLEIGMEKRVPVEMKTIIEAKDRSYAGKTAPASGLYLWQVWY